MNDDRLQSPAQIFAVHVSQTVEVGVSVQIDGILIDLWPDWIANAIENADRAQAATEAAEPGEELRASMQAITAAAFAVEAFGNLVKPRDKTRHQSTARRIAATMAAEMSLTDDEVDRIDSHFAALFSTRNKAVHPLGQMTQPVLRERDGVYQHPFNVWFGAENAVPLVQETLAILDLLIHRMFEARSDAVRGHAIRSIGHLTNVVLEAPRWAPITTIAV